MKRSLFLVLVIAAGCLGPRADPSAFFLLSSTSAPTTDPPLVVVLGVGPVVIPGYLDRPQIVVRVGDNEVALTEADRWAEPLIENLTRTLEDNLSNLLPGSSFVAYPWYESAAPDYGIGVEVRRFEADAAGGVLLAATWRLSEGGAVIDEGGTRIETSADGPDRAAVVAAQSRALAVLSGEIATAVRRAVGRAPAD